MEELQLRRRREHGDRPPPPRTRSLRGGGGRRPQDPTPLERAASFHGRASSAQAEPRPIRRPKTHPDLLAGARRSTALAGTDGGGMAAAATADTERRVPAKVLVHVTVQRSLLGPLHVMASTEWTVAELMAAAVRQYVKEGRRPALPTTEPSAFSLHYSQFSLEGLHPNEKLFGLGSRSFFLCLKLPAASASAGAAEAAAAASTSSSSSLSSSTSSSCSNQAKKGSRIDIPWLKFIDFMF